ncbi:MAG: hypothetical protein H7263_17225 [Candidatus Sericytochromatia bacterium]|nr:hypothetical protein [Candidatus Sericytochromatia bacterium]
MSDSIFSKIKKSFDKFVSKVEIDSPEVINEQKSENIIGNIDIISDISDVKDSKILEPINTDQKFVDKYKQNNNLTFNYDSSMSFSLSELLKDDKEFTYCCILDQKELSIIASCSKEEVDKDFVLIKIDYLTNIILNNLVLNLIESDSLNNPIERFLNVDNYEYQYVTINDNKIVILLTNQRNQLLAWDFMEKVRGHILT